MCKPSRLGRVSNGYFRGEVTVTAREVTATSAEVTVTSRRGMVTSRKATVTSRSGAVTARAVTVTARAVTAAAGSESATPLWHARDALKFTSSMSNRKRRHRCALPAQSKTSESRLLRHKAEETAAVGGRKGKLVIQIGEIKRGRVRNARPRNQVGALLHDEIGDEGINHDKARLVLEVVRFNCGVGVV